MAMSKDTINLISYNCKSVKRSVQCVKNLCDICDVIAIQEHWLLPYDIPFLGTIHEDFEYTGKSAVDTSAGLLRGRPFGGVGILWRKGAFESVSVVECRSVRITAIKVSVNNKSLLIASVYMPTDSSDNLPEFNECMGELGALVNTSDVENIYLLGDFNSHPKELFCSEMLNFCDDLQLLCADFEKLGMFSDNYTYISDSCGSTRWLDHCLVSKSAWNSIMDVSIKYNVFWSDHLPLMIQCNISTIKINFQDVNNSLNKIIWGVRNPEQISLYANECNKNLRTINLPEQLRNCCDKLLCFDNHHHQLLDDLYARIVNILSEASKCSSKLKSYKKVSPIIGWNRHVRDAHREARVKFDVWNSTGRSRIGKAYEEMCVSRRIFKAKLKWCQKNQEQIKMDILATQRHNKDFKKFWKNTDRLNIKPGRPVSIDGVSDLGAIANLFREHFSVKSPLGPSKLVLSAGAHDGDVPVRFSAKDVESAIKNMHRGRSPGHDSLSIEHLQYAGVHMCRVLSLFFSLCVVHSYLPPELVKVIVVPIVKNRTGDLSDKSNYRPISLATVIAKVFDHLVDSCLDKYINLNDAQFGFRPALSTEAAILCLKHTVRYYLDRNTPIYACFLDLSKAFDLVSYDILWNKLDGIIPSDILSVLKYWYDKQVNFVRWGDILSDSYKMECGVRQGGVTSPKLFNLYINALIGELKRTGVGCHVDGICFNNISYADDMVLLGPSVNALRKLLGVCETFANSHGLSYNVKKSEFMFFAVGKKRFRTVPDLFLNGTKLNRVKSFKYLGHYVTENLCDDMDMERERRALAIRGNMLVRRFAYCSKQVKVTLFKAYCQSVYTSSLWTNYTQKAFSALRVQYNNTFRMMMGLPRYCSASGMFAAERTDDFYAIIRKRTASLLGRVRASDNSLLRVIAERVDGPILRHWVQVLNWNRVGSVLSVSK